MLNDKSYGLIDDLSVEYNGNQRVSVEDESDAKLTCSGAFDFVDGVTRSKEYTYNGNGALTKDLNKGIFNPAEFNDGEVAHYHLFDVSTLFFFSSFILAVYMTPGRL